ncbi:MAG: hypothetical protein LBH19_02630 [Dysgonamonadaceae bacterium]|jgi:hypothetical protein|nr:hypothetical protein [Dysgonamonadaceae bacterium]
MENNIELRSEKVRNIVGKMPPALIRYGIGIFVSIITLLTVGSFYFEYTPSCRIDSEIKASSPDTSVILYIPSSIRNKVAIGSRAIIDFYSVQGPNDYKLRVTIDAIEKEMTITDNGAFYIATASLTEDSKGRLNNFKSNGYVKAKANLFFKKTSVFKHVAGILFN